LLSLNKRIFLIFSFLFIILILFIFLSNLIASTNNSKNKITINKKTSDISEPKFSINSEEQKIFVTAKEGNFLTEDEIALKKKCNF
jgi:predicted RND superfamily exporter protein